MQLCLEVYDDPALAGSSFGPYQYATDSQGDLATYTGQYYTGRTTDFFDYAASARLSLRAA
jgi:hypothetical protein